MNGNFDHWPLRHRIVHIGQAVLFTAARGVLPRYRIQLVGRRKTVEDASNNKDRFNTTYPEFRRLPGVQL